MPAPNQTCLVAVMKKKRKQAERSLSMWRRRPKWTEMPLVESQIFSTKRDMLKVQKLGTATSKWRWRGCDIRSKVWNCKRKNSYQLNHRCDRWVRKDKVCEMNAVVKEDTLKNSKKQRHRVRIAVFSSAIVIDVIVPCHTAGALLSQTAENNCPYHRVVGF